MGLVTRAMTKKFVTNNSRSEASGYITANQAGIVAVEKNPAINVDADRDISRNQVTANGRNTETNEVLKSNIHTEWKSIHTCPPVSAIRRSGATRSKNSVSLYVEAFVLIHLQIVHSIIIDMGLITRAMAKKLAANNGGSEASGAVTADVRRSVNDEKDSAVNVDSERDVNEHCISANNRSTESNEALNPKIHTESEPIATHASPSTDPESGIAGRRSRGAKATRATKPRRTTQATVRKGGSSRAVSTLVVSGKTSPDHDPSATVRDATHNNGTSEDTSVVTAGRKRRREETSDADSHTSRDNVSKRAETRRSRRNIQRTTIGEEPSVERNLRDSTNSSSEVKANDGLDLPATQYGAERRSDETHSLSSVPGLVEVCSEQFQEEKENASAAHLTSSPLQRSRRKGTYSEIEFVLARTMLALSKPRISSRLRNDTEPSGDRNEAGFPHRNPFESFPSIERHNVTMAPSSPGIHVEVVETETAPTWEARELDSDDFAYLIRRATPYRFEESNMRNEAFARPAQEE
ncbi:hypothetical protein ACEPAI_1871 [Sanghuangporus weigelae]